MLILYKTVYLIYCVFLSPVEIAGYVQFFFSANALVEL